MNKLVRNSILIISILISSPVMRAQSKAKDSIPPVAMKYVYTLDSALMLAQSENKPIFVNCYAHWAIPCRGMDQQVFNNKDFSEWMDQHFINLWVNTIKTEEGQELAKRYHVKSYAHYLILAPNGKLIHRIVGGAPLPTFQNKIERALSPYNLEEMNRQYESGERDMDFLREYITTLTDASYDSRKDSVMQLYMQRLPRSEWTQERNWRIIARQIKSIDDSLFHFVEDHAKTYLALPVSQEVQDKAFSIYFTSFFPYLMGDKSYNETVFNNLDQRMKAFGFKDDSDLFKFFAMAKARSQSKNEEFVSLLRQHAANLEPYVMHNVYMSLDKYKSLPKAERQIFTSYLSELIAQKHQASSSLKGILKILQEYDGLNFVEAPLSTVQDSARQEGKLIFVDVYAQWCGPCKMMLKHVFSRTEAKEYIDPLFIPMKVDAERGEGKEIAKKYGVSAYPTYLVLDAEGNLIHRFSGARTVQNLITVLSKAFDSKASYVAAKNNYLEGDHSVEAHARYLYALFQSGELSAPQDSIRNFIAPLSIEERTRPAVWDLFNECVDQSTDPSFISFLKSYDSYVKALGVNAVSKKLYSVLYCGGRLVTDKEMAQQGTSIFPYTMEYGKFVINASVGGHTGRFILDTAAPTTILKSLADQAGIKGLSKLEFEDSNGKSVPAEGTYIPELTLGGCTYGNVEAAIVGDDNPLAAFGIDGIIGYSLFGNKVLSIDDQSHTILITANSNDLQLSPDHAVKMLENKYFLPIIELHLQNGVVAPTMFDSGASGLLEINTNQYQDIVNGKGLTPLSKGMGSASIGSGGMENINVQHRGRIDGIHIGGAYFKRISVETTHGSISRLGSEILRYARVIIDYKDQKMYISPYKTTPIPIDAYEPYWDITITTWNDQLMAGIVWGEELNQKVTPGDQIVAINGKDYSHVNAKELLQGKGINMPGDTATLTLINSKTKEKYTVTIHKK